MCGSGFGKAPQVSGFSQGVAELVFCKGHIFEMVRFIARFTSCSASFWKWKGIRSPSEVLGAEINLVSMSLRNYSKLVCF